MPKPDSFTHDNMPLFKTDLYTNMYHAIPKRIRGYKDINDYEFEECMTHLLFT